MRQAALAVAAAVIALGACRADAQPADRWPDAAAGYVVEVDGVARWAGHPSARLRPASLTKILTALIVIESVGDDALVVVSARAAAAQGAKIGLRSGMQLSAGDLLTAMLLRSANDACLALAEHVSRNEHAFVARMNARAQALGLADSHFENACGFDGPGHRSSARDLARLARVAMASPRFAAIVAQERGQARTRDGRTFDFENTNALIGRVDGARRREDRLDARGRPLPRGLRRATGNDRVARAARRAGSMVGCRRDDRDRIRGSARLARAP